MSRSSTLPFGVGAPEPLTLLQQRLLLAEEEAVALIRDVGALRVPRGRMVRTAAPAGPLKMRWCDSLVSRVGRMESLLRLLRVTVLRLETERELHPSRTALLKRASEEEHRASRREVMELRVQLQQACRERDEARREVGRLGERVGEAAAAKVDVALAADELKIVKLEMSQKLTEMKEQMRRQLEEETDRRRALRRRAVEQLQNQDLLLEATRRNLHAELQVALKDKVNLQLELEKLKDEHSQLLQSSSVARETAAAQRELLERTIERLRGELSSSRQRGAPTSKDLQGVCGPAADGQTPETIQASRHQLHLDSQSRQPEPEPEARLLQARREIRRHREEVEKLQRLLTSTHSKSSRALESLRKASDAARADNKRLARSLERHRAAATLRDEELREARTKIGRLSEELGAVMKQRRREDASVKTLHREISERKRTVEDSSAGSGDLSRANQELRQQASELERLVSEQKARIREQRRRLKESRGDEDEGVEVSCKQEAEWERWTSTIQRWEAKRALAHTAGGHS